MKQVKATRSRGDNTGDGSWTVRVSLPKTTKKLTVDVWGELLFTRLAAVASPDGLGYALVQSGDMKSWLDGIAADLLGQSQDNKGISIKKKDVYPITIYKEENLLFKEANRKGKGQSPRSNNPNTVKEAKEAENTAKMK